MDPDGRIIRIDDNESQDFFDDVKISLEYLKKCKYGNNIIKELEDADTIFLIKKCDYLNEEDEDRFQFDNNIIYWSPKHTVKAANDEFNSPAICLMHELTHAWAEKTKNGENNFNKFCRSNKEKMKDITFRDKHEIFATKLESFIAVELGEPTARNSYEDLKKSYGYNCLIKLSSPLIHSKSRKY